MEGNWDEVGGVEVCENAELADPQITATNRQRMKHFHSVPFLADPVTGSRAGVEGTPMRMMRHTCRSQKNLTQEESTKGRPLVIAGMRTLLPKSWPLVREGSWYRVKNE